MPHYNLINKKMEIVGGTVEVGLCIRDKGDPLSGLSTHTPTTIQYLKNSSDHIF